MFLLLRKLKLSIFWLVLLPFILVNTCAVAQTEPNNQTPSSDRPNNRQRPRRNLRTPVFSGQKVREEAVVPMGNGEVIRDIVVFFVDEDGNPVEGKTKSRIITQEFALQPGDVYDADAAREGLEGVLDLVIVDRASLSLEDTEPGEAVMTIAVQESSNLAIGLV